jgi:hypothetical protein
MRTALHPRGRGYRMVLAALALVALVAAPAAVAQNPTGTLTGSVSGPDGDPLPGVTVTATSPSLQGTRLAIAGNNGSYKIGFLPPGDYIVTYELDGFATLTREVKISAAVNTPSDVSMQLATVSEEIVVTGQQAAISESATGSATYTADEVEKLPIQRDLNSTVDLAPGVHATGPNDGITIGGAMSFENLWTLNGVVINENVRGQELPLFIEDALQETTTQVSGISAEYGRFQGGVINAITKSGGNEFSGSFRVGLTNDDWISETDLTAERTDDINQTYEATLGGYLWKDHLWFFAAGRDRELTQSETLRLTGVVLDQMDTQTRLEGKLTGTIADSHTLIGSYLEIEQESTNQYFDQSSITGITADTASDRQDPQELFSLNYTGILTPKLFVEAQYSEREFILGIGSGGTSFDLAEGTPIQSGNIFGPQLNYNAPIFCGICENEERNNENLLGKVSWFESTESIGTHDIVFGYDSFSDIRFSVNHQSATDFNVWDSGRVVTGDGQVFPVFVPCAAGPGCSNTTGQNTNVGPPTWFIWWAVFGLENAQPTDFETNSLYVNDRWQLNDNLSFNLGVRYDETDGTNQSGDTVLKDEKVSPRLGLNWDVEGDGEWVAHANYGTYVAAPANSIADSTSSGGSIGLFLTQYGGPAINVGCTGAGDCLTSREALDEIFDWYLANGGATSLDQDLTNLPNLISVSIPGATSIIPETLISPSVDEYTVGLTKRLGARGLVRADVIYREFGDFYSNRTDLGTGKVETPQGDADLTLVGNFGEGVLERDYKGLNLQARYRVTDKLSLQGNYTWSELEGNIVGETGGSGPVTTSPNNYPEYVLNSWAYPVGALPSDRTHKVRFWAIYDLIESDHHSLSVSLLQNYDSGTPYSLTDLVDVGSYVTNPGYETPPTTNTYFFSDRGEFNFDDITRTDLSLNYAFLWNTLGRQVEVYLQPEVVNVLDEDNLINFDTTVEGPQDGMAPFNPFTETPVEGVNWRRGDDFGQPTDEDDFQQPRTFRFSVGFRF